MSLFKVQTTYVTVKGTGARALCILAAEDNADATRQAHAAITAASREGVREFRATIVTRNTQNVEFIGTLPL